jgi:hypothetical protein
MGGGVAFVELAVPFGSVVGRDGATGDASRVVIAADPYSSIAKREPQQPFGLRKATPAAVR